jgi:hypothetical protein
LSSINFPQRALERYPVGTLMRSDDVVRNPAATCPDEQIFPRPRCPFQQIEVGGHRRDGERNAQQPEAVGNRGQVQHWPAYMQLNGHQNGAVRQEWAKNNRRLRRDVNGSATPPRRFGRQAVEKWLIRPNCHSQG